VEANHRSREEYVRKVLDAYRQTPGTTGNIRHQDRLMAAALHDLAIPLKTVENALVLAAARRLLRPADAPPLATVRSLAYFQPVIDEVQELKASDDYFQHLRRRLDRLP
jgi:hypothetical protein